MGDWALDALCAEVDPALFFPDATDSAMGNQAKAVCRSCPVIAECLAYALPDPSIVGIWGGTSERERMRMRNGRPAKLTYRKPYCKRGHERTPENVGSDFRCLVCQREQKAAAKARRAS